MPEYINPEYQVYTPSGIVDSIDGNTTKRGAMISLQNLIPSPETLGLYVPRSAAYTWTSFPGFSSPGYVSLHKTIGSLVVGFVATARNPGFDEPFAYDTVSGTFLTITGITGANVPTSPATSGAWVPPTVDAIGAYIVFTHPGFSGGGNNFFGVLNLTGASITSLTGTTSSVTNPNVITSLSANPLTIGVTVGMTITGTGIPANTTIVYVNSSIIVISNAATASNSGVAFTITGGTSSSPAWSAVNTNTNPLPSVPQCVSNFSDRAYFACGNVEYYTDVLNPLNMANASNSLTFGGKDPIIGSIGQPFFTTSTGGIIAALLVVKGTSIWQITGDLSLNNLVKNNLITGTGTLAPRSLAVTPIGVALMANDGIRTVQLTGQVSEPNKDLTLPFLNNPTPSRVAAAYNTGIYRISTNWIEGGVLQNNDFFWYIAKNEWTGPHTISYDGITPLGAYFLLSGPRFTASILQSNVIPSSATDFFTELGVNMSFNYQTAIVPEFRAMPGWSLQESSIFLQNDQAQNITANLLDQTGAVLATYTLATPFLAPANASNFALFFTSTASGGASVVIPNRHAFQLTGMSANNLGLGSVQAHYQYQPKNNAYDTADFTVGSDLDFGSVTDPIILVNMDWGSVADATLFSVDFETTGTHPGPP